MAVRDSAAIGELAGMSIIPHLAPDAVHLLGAITAQDPVGASVTLARRDQEAAGTEDSPGGVDWLRDDPILRVQTWLRWKSRFLGPFGGVLNLSPSSWERVAQLRLRRGVALLSKGEVVITDRLHAMLIALQMGRRVIAIDNNNGKLSKYAETWFGASNPDVLFARNFCSANRILKQSA